MLPGFSVLNVATCPFLRFIRFCISFIFVSMNGLVSQIIMIGVGLLLIYLAIKKEMEPTLLLPMGFGAILVNLPGSVIALDNGILGWLYNVGIETAEVFPLLLFIGIGAMIDFGPVLSKPWLIFIGAAGQGGIFISMIVAAALGFSINDAASIGIIGAADGPTAILVSQRLMSQYVPAILVVAYCYMALVPIIQPVVLKICTTKKERCIRMHYSAKSVSKSTRILFPIITTIVCGTIAPDSAALVGMLMFGNLLRECGVLDSLSLAAQNMLSPLITLLLGLAIAPQMQASSLLQPETIMIMGFGLVAFAFDTACGVFFVKIANLFLKKGHKINPLIGGAGISAFPMSSRVVQKIGIEADKQNHLLPFALGANVSGQIGSVLAGGLLLSLVTPYVIG